MTGLSGLVLALGLILGASVNGAKASPAPTVVIVLDGFRHDYATREASEDVPAFTRWTS